MKNRNKTGLLGGTFNPIHLGHLDLGLRIKQAFDLDKVLYILSARPPHKKEKPVAAVDIRWQMLNAALAPLPGLVPCDIEMRRLTDSWTYVTVGQLRQEYPQDNFYFISGSEGFLKIKTWMNYRELLDILSFIVVLRKAEHRREIIDLLTGIGIPGCYERCDMGSEEPGGKPRIYLYSYESGKIFISSTLIRQKRRLSEPVDEYVTPEVKKIMEANRLYEDRGI